MRGGSVCDQGRWVYTPGTPQKEPPAMTAVCMGPGVFGLSSPGGGMTRAASAASPRVGTPTERPATSAMTIARLLIRSIGETSPIRGGFERCQHITPVRTDAGVDVTEPAVNLAERI